MSFVLDYHPFVTVQMEEHGTGNDLAPFRFEPTARCRQVLRDHRLVFRPRGGGFQLFYQTDPRLSDPLLGPIRNRTRMSFLLHLGASDFWKNYGPDLAGETGAQLYLDNLTPTGNVQSKDTLTGSTYVQDGDAARIVPPTLAVSSDLSVAPPPTEIRVKDAWAGTVLRTVPLSTAGGDRAITRLDLTDMVPGPYVLQTDRPGAEETLIYVDRATAEAEALAVVDLHWEEAQDTVSSGGLSYFIRFRRR